MAGALDRTRTGERPVRARRHPGLLDKRLLRGHYRGTTLAGQPAREGWVEPDLAALPRMR